MLTYLKRYRFPLRLLTFQSRWETCGLLLIPALAGWSLTSFTGSALLAPTRWVTIVQAAILAACLVLLCNTALVLLFRPQLQRLFPLTLAVTITAGLWSSLLWRPELLQSFALATPLSLTAALTCLALLLIVFRQRRTALLPAIFVRHPRCSLLGAFLFGTTLSTLPYPSASGQTLLYASSAAALATHIALTANGLTSPRWLPLQRYTLALLIAHACLAFGLGTARLVFPLALLLPLTASGLLLSPFLWQETRQTVQRTTAHRRRKEQQQLQRTTAALHQTVAARQSLWETHMHVASLATDPHPLQHKLNNLAAAAAQTLQGSACLIRLNQGIPSAIQTAAAYGDLAPPPIPLDQFALRIQYGAGQTVQIDDLLTSSVKPFPEWSRTSLRSMAGAPIFWGSLWLGALEVYAKDPGVFPGDAPARLALHAKMAALSLTQNQLSDESHQKDIALQLMNDVLELSISEPSPTTLLAKTAAALSHFLHTDAAAAYVFQRQGQKLHLWDALLDKLSADDNRRLKELFTNGIPPWMANQPGGRCIIRLTANEKRTIEALPLYSRQLPQAVIFFIWNHERKTALPSFQDAAFRSIAHQIAASLDRLHLVDSVQKIGLTDGLTGLNNRRFFDYVLAREISRTLRHNHPLALLMFDIDFFKKINDTKGHPGGDAVLREIGQLVRQSFRSTDIQCRYGGEEFAIILPETNAQDAFALAERFRNKITTHLFAPDSFRISATISIGISAIDSANGSRITTANELLFAADQSLYTAKSSGRNRTVAWGTF